jgi:hypothetical protein
VPRTATIDLPFAVVTVCGRHQPPSYQGLPGSTATLR